MARMLALDSMKAKISAVVQVETAHGRLRKEAALPILLPALYGGVDDAP
ncbi:hypothetical protein [Achromobacter sp. ESBL13]